MPSFRLSSDASKDLDDIADYIMEDNPERAISFVDELTDRFRAIAEHPKAYPTRADLRPGLRSCVHGNYLIFYRIEDDAIEIARVIHGARDIANLLP